MNAFLSGLLVGGLAVAFVARWLWVRALPGELKKWDARGIVIVKLNGKTVLNASVAELRALTLMGGYDFLSGLHVTIHRDVVTWLGKGGAK